MLRRALLCAAVLMCASPVFSQQAIKVNVYPSGDHSNEVADLLRAKIGSTLRYGLSDLETSDLTVEVICVPAGPGVACTAPTIYYSEKSYGIARPLKTTIAVGPPDWVAQGLFNAFVADTSDEKLQMAEKVLIETTQAVYSAGYKQGYTDGKAAAKPPATITPKKN